MVSPTHGYGQDDDGFDLPPPDALVAEIALVMSAHLPVKLSEGVILCLHDADQFGEVDFSGPAYHRWHVAELIAAIVRARIEGEQ
jgi:hypothetical protein